MMMRAHLFVELLVEQQLSQLGHGVVDVARRVQKALPSTESKLVSLARDHNIAFSTLAKSLQIDRTFNLVL